MKKLAATILRTFGRGFGVLALFVFATVGTASPDNISKTFEFGAGTAYPRSATRAFSIPCGTLGGVAAVVNFQRLGRAEPSNDVPIRIEFREPDTEPGHEGLIMIRTATAKTTEQTTTLNRPENNRGCNLPWYVTVRYANEDTAPFRIFGTIRLNWDGRVRGIAVGATGSTRINKGDSRRITLEYSGGLPQGIVQITGVWHHQALLAGPNPIKLKFELIDPNGTVVKTAEGYSTDESGSALPKLKLIYQVPNCFPGQWILRISNAESNSDALVEKPAATLTPDCP